MAMGMVSARAEVSYEQVLAFGMGDWLCTQPQGVLVKAGDEFLYGTTLSGGDIELRTSFRQAIPGCIYRVQYKDALDDPEWIDLPDAVVAESNSCSFTDSTANPASHRFYRMYQEP